MRTLWARLLAVARPTSIVRGSCALLIGGALLLGAIPLYAAPPVLTPSGTIVTYTEGSSPVTLDSGMAVSDSSSTTLASATVSITSGLLAGDTLGFTTLSGIIGSYTSATGVLTLSGTTTIANYQTVLRSIAFMSSSGNPTNSGTDPSRTISWQANDGTTTSAIVTSTVTVADAPLIPTGIAITTTAGTSFNGMTATFTDANPLGTVGDFTATINWGDGTPPSSGTIGLSGSTFQVTGTHTWAVGGTYTVTTTINDVGGSTAFATATATVAQSLTVSASAGSGVEGVTPATLTATCTDTDPSVTTAYFIGMVNWGDGSPPTPVFANAGGPPFTLQGTHVYNDEGAFIASITVTETKNSLTTTASAAVTVSDAPLTANPISGSATVGTFFSGTIATFTDANISAPATDFSGQINWGDGNFTNFTSANVTLTAPGHFSIFGSHNYTLSGSITVTVTIQDVGGSNATATSTIDVNPGPATHFTVAAPASTIAGSAFAFTVTAWDQFNNVASGYTGTVHFTSSDGSASLPANSPLTNGVGTFSATLTTAGSQTLTATDTVTSSITGTSGPIAVSAAAATHFTLSAPASATAGSPFGFTVTAFDQFNNTATGYGGTVHFTSSDGQVTLPLNSLLTNGSGTFAATLKTAGNQTLTATDTVTASITGTSGPIAVSAIAATHLMVTAPAIATAGSLFSFTVTALDPFNNTATSYGGTVHFTSSDVSATLPGNSPLTNGAGTFSATLTTAGNQTITATDTVTASITGTSGAIAVSAAAATHFTLSAPASATAGTAFTFAVTAFDQFNNTATGYGGTVHFTSSDGQATLPGNSLLTNGTGTFPATLKTAGSQTITATDTVTVSITGTSGPIAVSPAAATHFIVSAPATTTAGSPFSFTVTAVDPFNNTVTGYAGTVRFTSSDAQATLPGNSTLTNGTGTLSATLKTAGNQTITGTDTVTASITGASNVISVSAAAATHLMVTAPASATAGSPLSFTVTALDPFNNTATGYGGTVHFTSSDASATLPGNSPLTNGVRTFSATLTTAGNQTITATDTITSSITGTSGPITVSAAAATHFTLIAPASAPAGAAVSFTVTAFDQFNNTATGYGGTVHFTSSDGQAALPGNSLLTNGTGTFAATLKTAGSQTITATDTVTVSITGTSNPIAVGPAAATHLTVSAPATATAGTAFSFTVTALDQFNNTATGYGGTVHFTSSDSQAALPANSLLTNGSGTFAATLKIAGTQTLTATDTVTASVTATSNGVAVTAAAATHFILSAPATATANSPFSFTVTAKDPFNNTTTGYAGTVHFTSSDGAASLPANSTLTSGAGTFAATLRTLASETITAADTVAPSITGTSGGIADSAVADLAVVKSGPASANPGTNVTYSITVTNNGPSDAASATLTDALPAGTTFVSDAQTSGPSFVCTAPAVGATGTVTCSITTLPAGATAAFSIVVHTSTANLSNTATVASPTPDPNPANNSSTTATTINTADVSITKTASAPLPYGGQNITYTLAVANAGPATATGVTVTDALPSGSSLVSATPAGTCSGTATITCTIGSLAGGATTTITLVVAAPAAGGAIANTATVAAAQFDPNASNNSSTAAVTLGAASAIPALSEMLIALLAAVLAAVAIVRLR